MRKRAFTIGELARLARVNRQTIRYYERRGILLPSGRRESGYRLYDEEALKRLNFIRHAKSLGFTLGEIRELLGLRLENASACEPVREKTLAKLEKVEAMISDLESMREVLKGLLEACRNRTPTEPCPILKSIEKGGRA